MIKTSTLSLFLWAIQPVSGFTQKQYYAGTQQMTNCPCEAANFFKSNGYEGMIRLNSISPNCRLHTAVTDTVPEGFYFIKRNKKKPKPNYPKTSSIIRF